MFKRALFLGILSAILSSVGAFAYGKFYNENLFDFSMVIGPVSIISTCTFVSIFAAISFWFAEKVLMNWGEFVFNLLFALGSMASVITVLNFNFSPELLEQIHEVNGSDTEVFFPSYAIPMHFFPVLVWMTFKPLFYRNRS